MRNVRLRISTYLSIVAAVCAVSACTEVRARSPVQRDVESYAIASCLAAQDQPYLRDQGDAWASAIIQRAKGELDVLTAIATAVKAELAKGDMAVIHSETAPMQDKPLPVLYCGEIIDAPSIRTAIDKAIKELAPSYRNQ